MEGTGLALLIRSASARRASIGVLICLAVCLGAPPSTLAVDPAKPEPAFPADASGSANEPAGAFPADASGSANEALPADAAGTANDDLPLTAPQKKAPAKPVEKPKAPAAPTVDTKPKAPAAPAVQAKPKAPASADAKPKAATVAAVESKVKVPPPGVIVSKANLDEWRHLLGPGMQWLVDRGASLPVRSYEKILDPPPYREATEKYAGQVTLSPDGTALVNHIAGKPFPTIDPGDPWIATKLMFNFSAAIAIDDSDTRNFDCDTGQVGSGGSPLKVEKHFLIDHIRRLFFRERLVVDPKPEMPNRDKARFKEALYPLIEPFDLKGTGFTFTRYMENTRQDDTWLYLPQLRRVRRLSSAQRSDALFGQDTDADSFEGYQGNIAWMTWKLIGEQKVLGTMHAESLPVVWGKPSGDFLHDDVWEPRDVWVVEGVSKLPQYAYSKRVIYLDKEVFRVPFTDMYDPAGELWKVWVNNYKFSKEPMPGAKYSMPWVFGYRPSISMVDIQLEHGTNCSLPSARFPGEQGWYVYLGEEEGTDENFFDLSAMIAAGKG
jgi:hypothetical protein